MTRKTLYSPEQRRVSGLHPDEAKQEIVSFILIYSAEHGYSPSVREITARVGLLSTSTAQQYINELVAAGQLERDEMRSRTLRVKV